MRYLSLWVTRVNMRAVVVLGAAALVTAWGGSSMIASPQGPEGEAMTASADVQDLDGKSLGTATLTETPHGVVLAVALSGLEAGERALHLHEVGQCDGPDFTSAGGHYNPEAKSHGFKSPEGPHAGDMPNVVVGSDGELNVEVFVPGVTLTDGLLDGDGSAVVIHAGTDDYATDPAGDAGDRIACGVVEKG